MANNKLSDLGGIVCVSGRAGEKIITAKADGTAKAGALVAIRGTETHATDGDILGVTINADATDWWTGILLPKYSVDCDTAVADGDLVEVVIPRARRLYNVLIKDPGATRYAGTVLTFVDGTIGALDDVDADLENADHVAILTQEIVTGDDYAEVRFI